MSGLGEFEYIRSKLAPLTDGAPGAAGLRDDGAIVELGPGEQLAVTADTLIEGRHFLKGEDPAIATRRALRTNLSDLAAMGAKPFGYTASIVWPKDDYEARATGFVEGLKADQDIFGIRLIGGDTTSANAPWTLSIAAFGRIPTGQSLRRGRAQAGDLLAVTGTLGDAGLGLDHLTGDWPTQNQAYIEFVLQRFRLPQPRIAVGLAARGGANAAIDISDGLLSEAHHLARESGLQAQIDLEAMPLSAAASGWLAEQADPTAARLDLATRGDDYELLFAVPEDTSDFLVTRCKRFGVPLTFIGRLTDNGLSGALQVLSEGKRLKPSRLGFTQF